MNFKMGEVFGLSLYPQKYDNNSCEKETQKKFSSSNHVQMQTQRHSHEDASNNNK